MRELLPKDKGDVEAGYNLQKYSYEKVKTIVPELLTWIQDMNWPVARPISDLLLKISDNITREIIEVLKGDDEVWKYWCLHVFGLWNDNIHPDLIIEFKRIATNPMNNEIWEEVHEVAIEVLKKLNLA